MIERYGEYKDSGIEWIGEIPEGWEAKQIKRISIVRRGASPRPIADPRYFDTDGEWAWVRIADVSSSERYLKSTTQTLSELGSSLSVKIEPGSIFLSIAGTVGKPIITKIRCCIHDGFVYFPNLKINPEYLYYIFATGLPYRGLGKWGTQLNLNTDTVGEIFIPTPRKEEMKAIVRYLDYKTAEIDALITQKERLLELYEEEKTAIINHAVTKGIDPNAELKDSGVEWIGEIPIDWDVKKIKRNFYVKGRIGWKGLKSSEFLSEGFSYLVTGTDFKGGKVDWEGCYHIDKDRYEEDPYIQLHENDLLITKDGSIGKLAIIDELDKPACLNSGIFVVRSINRDFAMRYLYWVLMSNTFTQFNGYTSYGSTIQHLYQNVFVEFSFGFPTPEEQTAIANFLDRKTAEIDAQIAKTQRIIELQREYRTTLISDVVTGKIKVPQLADEETTQ